MANQLVHNILQRERERESIVSPQRIGQTGHTVCVAKTRFSLSLTLALNHFKKKQRVFFLYLKTTAFLSHDDHFQHSHSLQKTTTAPPHHHQPNNIGEMFPYLNRHTHTPGNDVSDLRFCWYSSTYPLSSFSKCKMLNFLFRQ